MCVCIYVKSLNQPAHLHVPFAFPFRIAASIFHRWKNKSQFHAWILLNKSKNSSPHALAIHSFYWERANEHPNRQYYWRKCQIKANTIGISMFKVIDSFYESHSNDDLLCGSGGKEIMFRLTNCSSIAENQLPIWLLQDAGKRRFEGSKISAKVAFFHVYVCVWFCLDSPKILTKLIIQMNRLLFAVVTLLEFI